MSGVASFYTSDRSGSANLSPGAYAWPSERSGPCEQVCWTMSLREVRVPVLTPPCN